MPDTTPACLHKYTKSVLAAFTLISLSANSTKFISTILVLLWKDRLAMSKRGINQSLYYTSASVMTRSLIYSLRIWARRGCYSLVRSLMASYTDLRVDEVMPARFGLVVTGCCYLVLWPGMEWVFTSSVYIFVTSSSLKLLKYQHGANTVPTKPNPS